MKVQRIFLTTFIFITCLQIAKSQIIVDSNFSDPIEINNAIPQKKIDIRRTILKVIWSQFDQSRIKSAPENFLVFLVFGIEIDSKGKVNAFYTSPNPPAEFTGLMRTSSKIKEEMKKLDYTFKGYENKILLFPLIMRKLSSANPQKDMYIIDDLIKMWPEIPPHNSLPIVFLEPFYAPFSYHRN